MDRKPNWISTLFQSMGILEIAGILALVAGMIVIIIPIWYGLSLNQQIEVSIGCLAVIIGISLFVWGQARKILYTIPNILYKRHSIVRKYAKGINIINDLNQQDFYNAYKLIDIDFANIVSPDNLSEFHNLIDTLYSQVKGREIPSEDSETFCNYLMKKTGLLKLLEKDQSYKKLCEKLNKIYLLIPNEDIVTAVSKFIKTSNSVNSLFPMAQIPDEVQTRFLPVKLEAAYIGINEKMDYEIVTSLAKVRESIDKYYGKAK
jgi:hypothetical protein